MKSLFKLIRFRKFTLMSSSRFAISLRDDSDTWYFTNTFVLTENLNNAIITFVISYLMMMMTMMMMVFANISGVARGGNGWKVPRTENLDNFNNWIVI